MSQTEHAESVLDLVCGPDSPLPESAQRYRLLEHLGSGGQADVYRGVRLCGGVASASVTVKIFRYDPARAVTDQLRSWDKGDAVLMDLNSRGVEGICRRVDGFHGAPPHSPGVTGGGEPIPFQVLDYLSGLNLRQYLTVGSGRRLDASVILRGLAATLRDLHLPARRTDCPVLHMDIKPSNVMVLPDGRARLIDFTAARYDRRDHITTVAFTAEAGAPEAFTGQVGQAYDVHGFGSVAYYLVTGRHPRSEYEIGDPVGSGAAQPAPWAVLRRDPVLDERPALRDLLLAPLADRPQDRPRTDELDGWVEQLGQLAAGFAYASRYADWGRLSGDPARPRARGRASVVPASLSSSTSQSSGVPTPTPTPVSMSMSMPVPVSQTPSPRPSQLSPTLVQTRIATPAVGVAAAPTKVATAPGVAVVADSPRAAAGTPAPDSNGAVAPPRLAAPPQAEGASGPESSPGAERRLDGPRRGRRVSLLGGLFLLASWMVWAGVYLYDGDRFFDSGRWTDVAVGGALAFSATFATFWLSRLIGRLVLGLRQRRAARPSHVAAAIFALLCGLAFLSSTPLSGERIFSLVQSALG
jgi:serine/threonine protein kinase